ncbi:hypothetical protein D3C87_2080450 [compost metagenome]
MVYLVYFFLAADVGHVDVDHILLGELAAIDLAGSSGILMQIDDQRPFAWRGAGRAAGGL